MASLALEAALHDDEPRPPGEGYPPLTDQQRRRILIAAAAAAAVGAPVRILDIRPASEQATRWTRNSRAGKRPPRPVPWQRRAGATLPAEEKPASGQGEETA